jgi:chitinase
VSWVKLSVAQQTLQTITVERKHSMKSAMLLLVLLALTSCEQNHVIQQQCMPIVAVYPSWKQQQMPVANIPWNRFTHLALVFAIPKADGSLQTNELDALIPPLQEAARANGKKLIVSIGGATGYEDAFQQIASSPEKLQRFTKAVTRFAQQYQLDGIDIDWEYWTKQAKRNEGGNDPYESKLLVNLLAELRKQLPHDVLLTTSVFAGYWSGEQYLSELQAHVDYVALMSYDFTGAWPVSPVKHHADFKTFKASIDFLTERGFKREKILAGIPFYGKEFVDGKNHQVVDKSYSELLPQLLAAQQPVNRGKLQNVFYETPELVTEKSHYILDQKMAGVMLFELTMDALDSPESLSLASNQVINPNFCNSQVGK